MGTINNFPIQTEEVLLTPKEASDSLVIGVGSAFANLRQAATRRVDLVMLGDSNQLKDSYGFTRGIDGFLSAKYGQYATPIYDSKDVGTRGFQGEFGQTTFFNDTPEPNHTDMYIQTNTTVSDVSLNNGIGIPDNLYFNTKSAVRFWVRWGSFPTGAGSFNLKARYEEAPFSTLTTGGTISTNTGDYGYNMSYLDLPEGAAALDLAIKGGFSGGVNIVAPMTFFYYRAEDTLKDSGISCHTLYGVGGDSLYDFATKMNSYSDNQLTAFFAETRRLQIAKGQSPNIVVYINSGLNDRNETSTPTLGEYEFADSSSAAGYIDNLTAVLNRIERVWEVNGWNNAELSFLNVASHVISDPNDAQLKSYRDALTALSITRLNLVTVDLSTLMTAQDAIDGGWYKNATTEREHLTVVGYDAVTALILQSLEVV